MLLPRHKSWQLPQPNLKRPLLQLPGHERTQYWLGREKRTETKKSMHESANNRNKKKNMIPSQKESDDGGDKRRKENKFCGFKVCVFVHKFWGCFGLFLWRMDRADVLGFWSFALNFRCLMFWNTEVVFWVSVHDTPHHALDSWPDALWFSSFDVLSIWACGLYSRTGFRARCSEFQNTCTVFRDIFGFPDRKTPAWGFLSF